MVVRSRFSRPVTAFAPLGNGEEPVYEEKIVDGVRKLVKVGVNNLHEFIQKSLDSTLIYNILDKYYAGNTDIINQSIGKYFDSTGFPKNLAECQQLVIDSEKIFSNYPVEVRQLFNNSSYEFAKSVSDGSFASKLNSLNLNKSNIKGEIKVPSEASLKDGDSNV